MSKRKGMRRRKTEGKRQRGRAERRRAETDRTRQSQRQIETQPQEMNESTGDFLDATMSSYTPAINSIFLILFNNFALQAFFRQISDSYNQTILELNICSLIIAALKLFFKLKYRGFNTIVFWVYRIVIICKLYFIIGYYKIIGL